MINLTVKRLGGRDYSFTVDESISIEDLKRIISDTVDVEPSHQLFMYKGEVLENPQILSSLYLDGETIHLVYCEPPRETADSVPLQSVPERPIRQLFSRMHVTNPQQRSSSTSAFATTTHLATAQSVNGTGRSGYFHRRSMENSRTLDRRIYIPPYKRIFELNYRVFQIKKFLECAGSVLESLEFNFDDNFSDYDYFTEEQRILMHRGYRPPQLSPQFQDSPSLNFLVSISVGLTSRIRHTQTSFISQVYSSTLFLQQRFDEINSCFYDNLNTSRPDSETLSWYEARRNRFIHYISHIYHGLSEITTVIETDSEYQLTTCENIHDEEERRVLPDRRVPILSHTVYSSTEQSTNVDFPTRLRTGFLDQAEGSRMTSSTNDLLYGPNFEERPSLRFHVRIDPFLSCHSYCCEVENPSQEF